MANQANEWAVQFRAALIRAFGGKCEVPDCETALDLEFAHVAPTPILKTESNGWNPETKMHDGRGRKERLTDISRHRSAYLLLCRSPHHERLSELERKFGSLAGSRGRALAALRSKRIDAQKTWVL